MMYSQSSQSPINLQQRVPLPHGSGHLVEYLVTIELFRDGAQSPWGFRLKGGVDVDGGIPLEIIKVFVGSASDGLLVPGDKILSINNQNTQDVSHFEAQGMFKTSGTSAKLEVARVGKCEPEMVAKIAGSQRKEDLQAEQPYSTNTLVLPQAKTILEVGDPAKQCLAANKEPQPGQAFRTSTLGMPVPRTLNEIGGGCGYYSYQPPRGPQFYQAKPAAQSPSPCNSSQAPYSQETKPEQNFHPGYVQAAPPQLPSSKDATLSKPHESETFKMIMRAEMVAAKNQSGIDAKSFDKTQHNRPLSQISDLSDESRITVDPVLKNTSINQSTTFKKLMHSVLGETEF